MVNSNIYPSLIVTNIKYTVWNGLIIHRWKIIDVDFNRIISLSPGFTIVFYIAD